MGRAGPSGRALDVVLEGSAGEVVVNGRQFGRSLGLRSTRFALSLSSAAAAPAPPPLEDASALQAMPDEASSMGDRPLRPASELRFDPRPRSDDSTSDLP